MRLAPLLTAVAALALTGCVHAQTQALARAPAAAPLSMDNPATAKAPGYLAVGSVDEPRILPAPPEKGGPRDEADRQVFRATRAQVGSARYAAATLDADEGTPHFMKVFTCALGVDLDKAALPKLSRLFDRVFADMAAANDTGKVLFKRVRPSLIDPGDICKPLTVYDYTRDYPSGHSSRGWLIAMILTELAPDRSNALLTRGRDYGESRVICGWHNATSVDAGRVAGAAVFASLHGSAEFRAEMDAARAELAAFRSAAPPADASRCAAETALLEPSPYR